MKNDLLSLLLDADHGLLKLDCGDGKILVSNKLQGRIFTAFDNSVVHRVVEELVRHPDPVEFNNLGGNSLWPAPEGGDFAWNYPPQGAWRVQSGINSVPTETVGADEEHIEVAKVITLVNRKGIEAKFRFSRQIFPLAAEQLPGEEYNVKRTGYRSIDRIEPLGKYPVSEVMISAWSLEQFPGAEGITGFGRCFGKAEGCLNDDFYGSVAERTGYRDDLFRFELGGEKRLQIGVKAASNPALIGALDRNRGVAVVRMTPKQSAGRYFNIADNDQKSGPFGAADMFSIFNGSQELDFHELETIAPVMSDADGNLAASTLESTSILMDGDTGNLNYTLSEFFGVRL